MSQKACRLWIVTAAVVGLLHLIAGWADHSVTELAVAGAILLAGALISSAVLASKG